MTLPDKSSTPASTREDAVTVLIRLRDAGHVAYFAGGCVRDTLLGLEPQDYDIATDAPPDRVRRLFSNTQAVGAAFGVILVRLNRSQIEVATFRAEGDYTDGRHPSKVRFTTAEEDAKRRDFTINGLFFDPVDDQVIDYVGGQADLKSKVLRAIGEPNARFEEDHLRLLRAVRFAARFGLTIDPLTHAAIARHATHLARISPERIADELRIMLTAPTRTTAWRHLADTALDEVIFRFLNLPGAKPHSAVRGARDIQLFGRLVSGEPLAFGLSLAGATLEYACARVAPLGDWFEILNDPSIRQISKALRQALRLSNEEVESLEGTLHGLEQLLRGLPTLAAAKRFLARPSSKLSRALFDALPLVGEPDHRRLSTKQWLGELEQTEYAPPPFISGDDLIARGFKPGKAFKTVLDGVYDAQLEDRVKSREEALALAVRLAKE